MTSILFFFGSPAQWQPLLVQALEEALQPAKLKASFTQVQQFETRK